jgi:hypothetical protein
VNIDLVVRQARRDLPGALRVYLLPGLIAGIVASSGGRLFAGNVSTFISIKLTNGQPKSGFDLPLRSTITPSWRGQQRKGQLYKLIRSKTELACSST